MRVGSPRCGRVVLHHYTRLEMYYWASIASALLEQSEAWHRMETHPMQEQDTKPRRVRARAIKWAGRPGGQCSQCGVEVEHLELDHIIPFFENGEHHLSNLQWLCSPCHKA